MHRGEGVRVTDVALVIIESPLDQGDLEVMAHLHHLPQEEVMAEIMDPMTLTRRAITIITLIGLEGGDLIDPLPSPEAPATRKPISDSGDSYMTAYGDLLTTT